MLPHTSDITVQNGFHHFDPAEPGKLDMGKLVSLGYFDNSSILYLASSFPIGLAVKTPKLLQ